MIPRFLPVLTVLTRRPGPAAAPLLRAAGLLAVTLPLLALAGVTGRLFWAPDAPRPPPPDLWISSLVLTDPAMVAHPDINPLPPFAGARPAAHRAVPDTGMAAMVETSIPALSLMPALPPPEPRAGSLEQPDDPTIMARPSPRLAAASPQGAAPQPDPRQTPLPLMPTAAASLPAQPPAETASLTAPEGLLRSPQPPQRPAQIIARALAHSPAGAATGDGEGDRFGVTAALQAVGSLAPRATQRPSARSPAVARLAAATPSLAPLSPSTARSAALDVPALTDRTQPCGSALTRAIPARPGRAEGGRAAMARLTGSGGTTRDAAIIRALEGGNLPDHLRRLVPVTLSGTDANGRRARITLCVMPDYLAVGSDRDFVRVPMGLPAATRVADRFDMILPTARMVDAIHAQAQLRLAPSPMTPGAEMASTDYFVRHNDTVEGQRNGRGGGLGHLVSGHKKDLVITNRLSRASGRVAIYGWHRANGQPIQPLSTVHGQNYADYSHGVRLISRTAYLDGRAMDLRDLLADGRYSGLLTGEGPIATRTLLASLR